MMKKLLAFALMLSMCLMPVLYCTADAAEAGTSESDDRAFEKIIEEISETWSVPEENLFAGYMNLVTGEEHYWQGDKLEYCASMYKVPLSMYVSEKIVNGELNWKEKYPKIPFEYVLKDTLYYSSNKWARFLWESCGCYADYKKGVMPYMGIEKIDNFQEFFVDNKYTARQMISCLKTLYENPDKFPNILDIMKEADPERFFRFAEKRYPIAQKYGYVVEGYDHFENACGIVFTDEPIAIVMFTKNALYGDETLSAFCTAMCDYTQNGNSRAPE